MEFDGGLKRARRLVARMVDAYAAWDAGAASYAADAPGMSLDAMWTRERELDRLGQAARESETELATFIMSAFDGPAPQGMAPVALPSMTLDGETWIVAIVDDSRALLEPGHRWIARLAPSQLRFLG